MPAPQATPPRCGKAGFRSAIYGNGRWRLRRQAEGAGLLAPGVLLAQDGTKDAQRGGRPRPPLGGLDRPVALAVVAGVLPCQRLVSQRLGQSPAVEAGQGAVAGPVLRAVEARPHPIEL